MRRVERAFENDRNRLREFVGSRVQSTHDAEDIVQDVFLRALEHADSLEAVHDLTSWLFRTARNRVIDWYRRRSRATVSLDAAVEAGFDAADEQTRGAEERLVRQAAAEQVERSLDELSDAHRSVVVGRAFEGRSFRQLADSTGEPIGTLLSRKHAAYARLKELLAVVWDAVRFYI